MEFICQDCCFLTQFKNNEINIGYSSLILHEMPKRIPMNVLIELARISQYMVILDWIGPHFPYNKAGFRNRYFEFIAGPSHFAGFRHFVKIGGIQAHIKSLMKYMANINIIKYKTIDQHTMGLYILDSSQAILKSKL